MIYHGLRSSRFYLHKLEDVSRRSFPHHLVSVMGGGAFLHAIGRNTKSITLLDTDSDAQDQASWIISGIRDTLHVDNFERRVETLYRNSPNVQMRGHNLEVDHYNWHFGEGNFASQLQYTELREKLRELHIIMKCANLFEFDYSHFTEPVIVLASNCDSPLFNHHHDPLKNLLATARVSASFISWLGEVHYEPNIHNKTYSGFQNI